MTNFEWFSSGYGRAFAEAVGADVIRLGKSECDRERIKITIPSVPHPRHLDPTDLATSLALLDLGDRGRRRAGLAPRGCGA